MENHYAIGIDLGGTNLRAALVSEEGQIMRKVKVPSSENLRESLLASISEILEEGVVGIGFGVAGLIDREKGSVLESPNIPSIEGWNIAETVRDRFGLPVCVENDANAAALGEKWRGEGNAFGSFVLVTLGTGIGGGIIHNNALLNVPAEIGHMSINSSGERCSCGNIGCLEAYASAKAMLAHAIGALEGGSQSLLKGCCQGNIYKLTPEDIYRTALEGDTLAREILRQAGRYLGVGISTIINIFGPDAIVLTGGLIGAWNIYIKEAVREASRRTLKPLFDRVRIIPSSLGDDAGILGSAHLVFSCRKT